MKIILIILAIFLSSCKLNKIVNHHGIHNLEIKSKELLINETNINQINKLLGPPSSKSYFDNKILVYLERKTSNSKLHKLGKKKLITNNVLLLEVNNKGLLISKKFFNKDDINKIEFSKKETNIDVGKQSFIYRTLYGVSSRISDPLGKKRGSISAK
ncbi:hypothetical protein [Candidatus Pelagibacter sp.]|uniref:hypothetical protein n=1 Tax=Candidatus Pelagibacter sp. TaxID=2024849 RepID=UPI003F87B245